MSDWQQVRRSGLPALHLITALLQRRRTADPTEGLYEAAELQFWFSRPNRTDHVEHLFWLDADGQPVAAACMFDFSGGSSLVYTNVTFCPFVLPDASAELLSEVIDAGLAEAQTQGFESVELEVERGDAVLQTALAARGFSVKEADVLVECWLTAADRPPVSTIADGYQLVSRREQPDRPHYLDSPNKGFSTARLNELTLYRPEFDLTVIDSDGNDAGHCMFWLDPVTATGVVEPMRVEDEHQKKGLARHLLTAGVELLAQAGAERISIGYEPDNPASGHLYRDVGFVDTQRSDLYAGPTAS